MKLSALLIILSSVLLTAGAQLSLKVASRRFRDIDGGSLVASIVNQLLDPLTVLAIGLYVGSTILWLLALRQVPLSLAFPFSGLTIAIVAGLSMWVLGEAISWQHATGILLIMVGVGMLAQTGTGH